MIRVERGSILDANTDCIVNPANGHLRHGGGLARVIANAACPIERRPPVVCSDREVELSEEWELDHENAPLIATGNVHVTRSGCLEKFKGVIHAVGPVWNGGDFYESKLLWAAYANACAAAHERKWNSIAFPAISCGIFGYPVKKAAPVAIQAVEFWAEAQPNGIGMDVAFYLMEDEHIAAFSNEIDH